MGKIGCKCGNTIVDQANNLSYKGDIVPDSGQEEIFNRLYELIDTFVEAVKSNKKEAWMRSNELTPPYPQDLSASSMINDLFYNYYLEKTKEVFQCDNCGRILIQKGKTNQFISFKPETDDWQSMLDKLD
jgi:hypothetical protein